MLTSLFYVTMSVAGSYTKDEPNHFAFIWNYDHKQTETKLEFIYKHAHLNRIVYTNWIDFLPMKLRFETWVFYSPSTSWSVLNLSS